MQDMLVKLYDLPDDGPLTKKMEEEVLPHYPHMEEEIKTQKTCHLEGGANIVFMIIIYDNNIRCECEISTKLQLQDIALN